MPLCCPPPVPIHDDREMPWKALEINLPGKALLCGSFGNDREDVFEGHGGRKLE
jgi:hypothetical protein